MRSCRLHGYGPNGIGMRRGAKYKVLSTIFNILRQVSFIQCTRVGHRFISAFTRTRAFAALRSTAILTTATSLPLPHMHVCSSPRT